MTPEEMKRMMEFLLEQQARFDARIQKEHEERLAADAELQDFDMRLRESDERLRDSLATLTAALLRVTDLMEDLSEAGKRTDDRLNALINVVEKHISSPGHSSPPH